MYTVLLILLLLLALFIAGRGFSKQKTLQTVLGISLGLLTLLFFWFMNFWGDKLWFDQMGYNQRFWTVWTTRLILLAATFILGGAIAWLLTINMSKRIKYLRLIAVLSAAVFTGFFWFNNWEMVLRFLNRIQTGMAEPVLNRDTGFYLFTYPFLKLLYIQVLVLVLIVFLAAFLQYRYLKMKKESENMQVDMSRPQRSLFISTGIVFLVLAFGRYLGRFGILFSEYGIVSGPGWTDDKIRLPMLTVVIIITLLAAILLIGAGMKPDLRKKISIKKLNSGLSSLYLVAGSAFAVWFILLAIVPSLFQWLKVEPNEISVEKPYIENNIRFTRSGFHLDKAEVREYQVSEELDKDIVENNRALFSNIRLWDYRALDAVYRQFQEIRLYYEFHDVDIDRYVIDGRKREVMISGREMLSSNLPFQSQSFVNKHFKYTHGYGAVLNLVSEFTEDGLPDLLVRDIPPVSRYENLEIDRPELYYGEMSENYVVVNSEEKEFDYPSGDENVYASYEGKGGVRISNFWRKFLYGWKLGGTRFLFSGYPTSESRIMMYRKLTDRIKKIAPFLYFDNDPYIIINDEKLY